jgi:hypothetical protein
MRPPSIFYAQQKPWTFDARHRGVVAIVRNHQDWFGFAPICFIPACRRAGRCCGDAQKGRFYLPPCLGHYWEEGRYLSFSPGGLRDQHQAGSSPPRGGRRVSRCGSRIGRRPPGSGAGGRSPSSRRSTARARRRSRACAARRRSEAQGRGSATPTPSGATWRKATGAIPPASAGASRC